MTSFVLVHGAWHGSWCWKRVRRLLQAQGHDVFTPTLTGVGERSHLLSRDVNLETHILDVVNLIRWEELSDIVLCGHRMADVSSVASQTVFRIASVRWFISTHSCSRTGKIFCSTLPSASAINS